MQGKVNSDQVAAIFNSGVHTLGLILKNQPAKPMDVLGVSAVTIVLLWAVINLLKLMTRKSSS